MEGEMRKKFFLSPDGSSFSCRRFGWQHLLAADPAAAGEMWDLLQHEGWQDCASGKMEGAGWKLLNSLDDECKIEFWFLQEAGQMCRSIKELLDLLGKQSWEKGNISANYLHKYPEALLQESWTGCRSSWRSKGRPSRRQERFGHSKLLGST
jgi:hypothetical protein